MASNPLLDSLRNIDPDAAVIYSDEVCAWVRCRLAIVGRVQLNKSDADAFPEKLSSSIKKLTNHAYAVLDELPDDQLSFEDLWNLVLLISVPWTQTELEKRTKIVETLAEFATDISRSRKLILWSDVPPEEHFGSLGAGDKPWSPPSGDPLRETVKKFARNPDEDSALEALFKRRLSDEDIDDLLRPANYSDIDRELKPRQNAVIRGFDLSLYYAGLNNSRARREGEVITTVIVSGFRGVPQRREFTFAPITLLAGRNGLGKTTVFDAIDWCLFGSHWRLGYQPEAIRNLYNPSCAPSVSITLKLNGRNVTIDRTLEGVALDGDTLSDKDLIAELVTDIDVFGSYTRDIPERVRQMVYLPQAEIRAIVNPQHREERQALFQSLLGVPNAAVLQASIRKVRERFATRRRRLEEQHSDLQEQIETLSDAISTAEPAAENDKRALFARIFRISKLKPQNAQASQTEELLSLARARLHELLDQRVQLEGFQAFRRQAEADLKLTRDEIVDVKEAIDKLTKEIADADKALEEANQHRDRGAKALRLAERNLSQTSAKIDELIGLQLRAKELDGAQRLMDEEQKSVLAFEPLVESATQNVALAKQALEVARTSANHERDSLSDARTQMARFRELQQLRSTRNSLLQKLSSCEERMRELTTKVGDLGEQISVARLRFEELDVNHRVAASRAADRDRLASLVTQVTGLVNDLQMNSCPVCGHEYGTAAELSDHIAKTGAQREKGDLELMRLTESVEESRSAVSELEEQVAGKERDLRSETESREQFRDELADLSDTESALVAEPSRAFLPEEIEGLEQQLRQAEERLEQLEASLSDAESSLETTDAELLRARERFTTAKSRFERLSLEPPESNDGELEQAEQTIESRII